MRIKIKLSGMSNLSDLDFFVNMPAVPREEDLIEIEEIIEYEDIVHMFNPRQMHFIASQDWHVDFICWTRDEKGYFPVLYCACEIDYTLN